MVLTQPVRFLLAGATPAILLSLAGCSKSAKSYPVVSADAVQQQRYVWNIQTLVEPYEQSDFRSRKWDDAARRALTEFARTRARVTATNEPWAEIIASNCTFAVNAGCNDPMVAYLHARHSIANTNHHEVFTRAFLAAASGIENSTYPEIRKFYTALRTAQQIKHGAGTNNPPEMHDYRRKAMASFVLLITDKTVPPGEASDACDAMLEVLDVNRRQLAEFYFQAEKPLFDNWSNESFSWLFKGKFYVEHAWAARGSGFSDSVTEEGWKEFGDRLAVAAEALEQAWKLNPKDARIAREMLTVELGQGKGRDRMELWFGRAMALQPDYYSACSSKRNYLEPKWHGTEADMLAFGLECVESKEWGGNVPLILVDVHDNIEDYLERENRKDYWKRPEVWPDIDMAFQRFFELNPTATGWLHNYARYAYWCERWDKLNELLPKFRTTNYSFFGGRAAFEKMAQLAGEHSRDVLPAPDEFLVQSKRLASRVTSKINQEKTSEKDFQRELTQIDALLEKFKDRKPEDLAGLLFSKVMLYLTVFEDVDEARELIEQLKQRFPDTTPARNADRMLASILKQQEAEKVKQSLKDGVAFPTFDEKDLNGRTLSLAAYKGKIVLIDFWATWCGPCVEELPNVMAAYKKHHARGFEIIGISLDENRAKLDAFIRQKNMTWPQYFDGEGWQNKLAQKYGVNSIPTTYLLDGEGKIIGQDLRGEDLEAAVARALAAK